MIGSAIEQWRYVYTRQNPADLASRGVKRCTDLKVWLEEPKFLALDESHWPSNTTEHPTEENIEFKRKFSTVNVVQSKLYHGFVQLVL